MKNITDNEILVFAIFGKDFREKSVFFFFSQKIWKSTNMIILAGFIGELLVRALKYERNIKIIDMCMKDNTSDIILKPEKIWKSMVRKKTRKNS